MIRCELIARAHLVCGERALVDAKPDGRFKLFGGKVKRGEKIVQALRRELAEELGARVEFAVGPLVRIEETFRGKGKKRVRVMEFVFLVHLVGALVQIQPAEGKNPKWVPLAESGLRLGVALA